MEKKGPLVPRSTSRRGLLAAGVAAVGGAAARRVSASPSLERVAAAGPNRVLRFAHPTDIHVQPERHGAEGMAAAFDHMMGSGDPPQMIITGGDLPMDTAYATEARTQLLWDLFNRTLAATVPASVRVEHVIGNHDIWGIDKAQSATTGNESLHGKAWFLKNFGYAKTYRSFDLAGWHFILLDSMYMMDRFDGFRGRLDDAQFAWLARDLEATPKTTPVVVVSHMPIIAGAALFFAAPKPEDIESGFIPYSGGLAHLDYYAITGLFRAHGNVKLCLAGHSHLADRVEYDGVTYASDGAVSGFKWTGPWHETREGYGLVDLYDDGTFQHRYVEFGWKA